MCAVPKPVLPDAAAEGWGWETLPNWRRLDLKHLLKAFAEGGRDAGGTEITGLFALVPATKQMSGPAGVTVSRGGVAASPRVKTLAKSLQPVRALLPAGRSAASAR